MIVLTRSVCDQVKKSFLVALAFFELGSLLCGVAPTSTALIVGRAIAGIGDGAIFAGAYTILATTGNTAQTEEPMKGSTLISSIQCRFEEGHWPSVASVQCLGLLLSWDHWWEASSPTICLGDGVFTSSNHLMFFSPRFSSHST